MLFQMVLISFLAHYSVSWMVPSQISPISFLWQALPPLLVHHHYNIIIVLLLLQTLKMAMLKVLTPLLLLLQLLSLLPDLSFSHIADLHIRSLAKAPQPLPPQPKHQIPAPTPLDQQQQDPMTHCKFSFFLFCLF